MKPSREFKFDTSKINIEPIGNAREIGGYGLKEVVSHENLNDMMANISDWLLYLSKVAGKSIYVDRMGGDDSTGDGTEDNPYLSPMKAINEAERYGITFIKLMTSGDHDITENVQVSDKTIFILEESGVTARLRFYNYLDTTNRLYGINSKRSKFFIALTDGVYVSGPVNPAANWSSSDNVCFLVDEGESEINIVGPVATAALSAASGNPVLIRQDYSSTGAKGHGRTKLSIHGNIDTEGELYILESNGAIAQIQYAGTMDNSDRWIYDEFSQNEILYSGMHSSGLGDFTLSLATDGVLTYTTTTLDEDISDVNLKTQIEDLLDDALNDAGEYDMTVEITTTRGTLDVITSLTIEIKGDNAGRPLPLTMFYNGNVRQGAMREIQGARKNGNIFSNIPELY